MTDISFIKKIIILLWLMVFSCHSYAIDTLKLNRQKNSDKKAMHKIALITRALEITEAEYGPFNVEIVYVNNSAGKNIKSAMERGFVSAAIVPASNEWDQDFHAIQIPVRLGLLSYRLLLVNKADIPKFNKITTQEGLNNFTAGVIKGRVISDVLLVNNIQRMESSHFEGVFLMLNKHRFDYIPRAVYEVYDDINDRQPLLSAIDVEPTLALYIPTSSYVYVTKSQPRIAKRLALGLHKLLANGEIKELLYKYYGDDIKRSNLGNRKIITIDNPYNIQHNTTDEQYYLTFK